MDAGKRMQTPNPQDSHSLGSSRSRSRSPSPPDSGPKDTNFEASSPSKDSDDSDSSFVSPPTKVAPSKPVLEPPPWVRRADDELHARYPGDSFVVVPRPKPADTPDAEQEWRMKCQDW